MATLPPALRDDERVDLTALRRVVENEIENYQYSTSTGMIGNPWTEERVRLELAVMKASVVTPYWTDVELRDTIEQFAPAAAPSQRCVIVADDLKGTLLAFDPVEREFMLAVRHKGVLLSIGVRGDAVGCFMAR